MPIVQSIADHSLNKTPESSLESFSELDDQTEPFPDSALSPNMRAMAVEISKSERVPVALPAVCLLAITAASIGKGYQVKSGGQRTTMGNIYVVPSADSGSGKSQVFRHAFEPFNEYQTQAQEEWKTKEKPKLQAEKDIVEEEIKGLINDIKKCKSGSEDARSELIKIRDDLQEKRLYHNTIKDQLNPPAYSVEDVTAEALAARMESGDEVIASLSADAGGVINNVFGKYSKLDRPDDSLYVKAFSGDMCKVDRKGSDDITLEKPCLSILWLVQPDKIESLLAEPQLIDGGFIPRLLMCHTNAEQEEIVGGNYYIPSEVKNDYHNRIREIMETYRMAEEPKIGNPTPEALDLLIKYHNEIVRRQKKDLKDIKPFASRWTEQAVRIGVVLHVDTHGKEAHKNDLSLDTAEKAITIARWFADQQLDILLAGRELAQQKLEDKVMALVDENPNGITTRDVYRKRLSRSSRLAHEILKNMEAKGILISREKMPEGGGTISRIYTRDKR